MGDLPVLSILTFLPAAGALLLGVLPKQNEEAARPLTLVISLVTFALSAWMWMTFTPGANGFAFVEDWPWIASLGVRYGLAVDGLALAMVVLTTLLVPLAVLCSWHAVHKRVRLFHVAVLLLETGMLGVFTATDLVLFYVFWEVVLLPMALMIGIWGGPRRVYASVKFVLYTLAGSLLMFVAILYSWVLVTQSTGVSTFDIATWARVLPTVTAPEVQIWLFAAFALAFAIKVPMFPLHTWLPDAHVEAPTAGSVILAGVLLKMGGYGFLRFAIPFFPQAAVTLAPLFLALSVIGIIYGSLVAMVQTDIKKLVAYSSVAHLGFVMLGIFSGDVAATQGAVLQMVNHGLSTGALFLLVGVIYERAHTRGVDDFGGIAHVMPLYSVLFLVVTLASIGLPGLNGFVGEFLVLLGTFQTYPWATALGVLGVVLGAVYMLTLYRRVFFGLPRSEQRSFKDPDALELASLTPLIVLIFVLGVAPNLVLAVTEAPVAKVVDAMQHPVPRSASLDGRTP